MCKTLLIHILKDMNKWRGITCSCIDIFNIAKVLVLSQSILSKHWQANSEVYWKRMPINEFLKKFHLIYTSIEISYETLVNKVVRFWCRNNQIYWWDRRKSSKCFICNRSIVHEEGGNSHQQGCRGWRVYNLAILRFNKKF